MKVRILLSLLASTSIFVTGCQQNLLANPANTNQNVQTTTNNVDVNGFKFTKVSQTDLAKYNSMVSQNAQAIQNKSETALAPAVGSNSSSSVSAPAAMPMAAISSGGVVSSDMARGGAFPMSYFPYSGSFEEYTVVDFEEAKSAGFVGSYSDIVTKVIKPVIKTLASDARMTYVNGNLDANGMNKNEPQPTASANPNYYYNQYQWTFTFVSSANKEVYNFYISSESTLILKQKWGLKDLSYDNVKIDSSQAIKIVTDAIKDKTVATTNQDISYAGSNTEFIYDLPKNTNWYLYLEKEKDALIWNINLNINYNYSNYPVMPMYDTATSSGAGVSAGSSGDSAPVALPPTMPTKSPVEYWYSGSYARIDATTGKILQFTRPTRTKAEPYPVYSSYPMPAYSGGTTAVSAGAPVPEAKPTAVVTN